MSYLLNSGMVGIVDKSRDSVSHIYDNWKISGLLDGLDFELAVKVSVSFEVAARILLINNKISDIYLKHIEEIIDGDSEVLHRISIIIFPIIRRIITNLPEGSKYVPEILTMVNKEYNTDLCKSIYAENESSIIYLYEEFSLRWNSWNKDRKYAKYKDFKNDVYEKYLIRLRNGGYSHHVIQSYEEFVPIDYEAEFHVCVANKIEQTIRKYIKNEKRRINN